MIIVSEESISKAEAFFEDLTDLNARKTGEQFALEQPFLLIYIQAMASIETEEEDLDELMHNPLAEDLNYYAMFLWKAFEFEAGKIATITEEEVEKQSDASMNEMQNMVSVIEGANPESIAKQVESMQQPVLFIYMMATLFGDFADPDFEEDLIDEDSNYIFLVCNQVIKMLDHKVNGTKLKIVK